MNEETRKWTTADDEPDMDFFEKLYGSDPSNEKLLHTEEYRKEAEQPIPVPAGRDEVIIDGKQEVGSVIEYRGEQWLVTLCAKETEVESASNDEYDERLSLGWHSWLVRLDPKVMEIVAEQYAEGAAHFTDSTVVRFSDETSAHSLFDLAYSPENGLYDRSASNG